MTVTNEQWRAALAWAWEQYNLWWEITDKRVEYSTRSLNDDHGCPPPLEFFQASLDGVEKTATHWQDKPALWCYPAVYPNQLDVEIPEGETLPVACMGTQMWFVLHALKYLGLEDEIPRSQIEQLKRETLQHKQGVAGALVNLGWASYTYDDPEEAEPGDLGCIGYFDDAGNGEIHHWFIVAPATREEAHTTYNGNPAILTLGASPYAEGVGTDPYYKEKTKNGRKRRWLMARIGEE